jgi:hypothetical protein
MCLLFPFLFLCAYRVMASVCVELSRNEIIELAFVGHFYV